MRTIAVTNQKGGVGKTTTVANLGAALAHQGLSVCLLDLDPQSHLTMHFGIDTGSLQTSMYDVLTAEAPLSRAAMMVEPQLTIVPSVIDLAAAEMELASVVGREQILRDRLMAEELPYDILMIDCPPSLGLLTLNALSAVEEVVIPLQPHFLALQGLGRLLETVALVGKRINPRLRVSGVVFCMFETTRLSSEVVNDVTGFFDSARGGGGPWGGTTVFKSRIRRNVKLAECPSYGTTILRYDPSSHGAADYTAMAVELAAMGKPAPAEPAADSPHKQAPPEAATVPPAATEARPQ